MSTTKNTSYTTVAKLIEALKDKGVIKDTDKQLNILFDNHIKELFTSILIAFML